MSAALRIVIRLWLVGVLIAGAVMVYAYSEARRLPVVRQAAITLTDWPADVAPLRAVLIGDIHIGNETMDARRLTAIVDQINALAPDFVLIAGDFIAGHAEDPRGTKAARLVDPLSQLRPRIATVAVLGNHDHWTNAPAVIQALERAGIILLSNRAARFGPLVIGGLDDDFTHRAQPARMLDQMAALAGPRLVLSHSPDPAARIKPPVLILAGHTHCGQIVFPIIGRLVSVSRLGDRYACGLIREPGRTVIVTAGLGTSQVPFRLGAVPDLWLITLGPLDRRADRPAPPAP
ncbi:MAG: metallophosphoesterase [Sphingomonas sp.]|nr:metallophosphoesterase [Sphingomonas sp.]